MKQNVSLPSEFVTVFKNTKFTRQLLQVVSCEMDNLMTSLAGPGFELRSNETIAATMNH